MRCAEKLGTLCNCMGVKPVVQLTGAVSAQVAEPQQQPVHAAQHGARRAVLARAHLDERQLPGAPGAERFLCAVLATHLCCDLQLIAELLVVMCIRLSFRGNVCEGCLLNIARCAHREQRAVCAPRDACPARNDCGLVRMAETAACVLSDVLPAGIAPLQTDAGAASARSRHGVQGVAGGAAGQCRPCAPRDRLPVGEL